VSKSPKKWSGERWRSDGSEMVFPSDPNAAAVSAEIRRHQREMREGALRRAAAKKAAAASVAGAPERPREPAEQQR
jgi:hypothetical protein